MSRPLVGITTYGEPVSYGPWRDQPCVFVPEPYVRQIERAGGVPVLIPPLTDCGAEVVDSILARIDALVLAGGADIDPLRYADIRHPASDAPRSERDDTEIALARRTAELDIPVLGVCRGMQLMAVAAGGALEQHTPDRVGHVGHSPTPGAFGTHGVRIEGGRLARLLNPALDVPTHHHQSVLTHPGYTATAWADDGTLEAMEDSSAHFRIAVQWHPEMFGDNRLFEALVAAVRER